MQTTPTLRERKKARTREALVEAAQRLFAKQGYDATTVDEIAAEAEVSRRTFFRYFATKEAVVFPDNAERLANFQALLRATKPGEAPFECVRRAALTIATGLMEGAQAYAEQQQLVTASPALMAYELETDREWEAAIAEALMRGNGLREGEPDPQLEYRARILAGALMGAVRATLKHWREGACESNLIELGGVALELLEGGVGRTHFARP